MFSSGPPSHPAPFLDWKSPMENWRHVWRNAVAPLLSTNALEALQHALSSDDSRLIQGETTSPPPLQCVQDWPCESACLIGYAGWIGEGLETVGEIEEFFSRMCYDIDKKLGQPAGCRWLLNWFDDTPREEMRRELLQEVELSISARLSARNQDEIKTVLSV